MAIQPIDLQTMYQQLNNVSKTVAGQQQAQLTEAMQQQNTVQKNLENATKVNQASNEKSNAKTVDENGRGGSSSFNQSKNQSDNNNSDEEKKPKSNPYNPYLGSIIDITR